MQCSVINFMHEWIKNVKLYRVGRMICNWHGFESNWLTNIISYRDVLMECP